MKITYKELLSEETNEERFGIIKQPKDTCPMIDELIKKIRQIQSDIKGYSKAEPEELLDMVDSVDTEISYFESNLEEIRTNTQAIRSWGNEWKQKAIELQKMKNEK
mgnify:CR=1 FL=1